MTGTRGIRVVTEPFDVTVRPPGSKSETIRALAAAAMSEGRSHIYGGLHADDSVAMIDALGSLGVAVDASVEPWTVDGKGGWLNQPERPIDVNESGLTARIVIAMAASLDGTSTIAGRGRLPERPMHGLIECLRGLGVEVDGEHLPLTVTGHGHLWGGTVVVDCAETSQYATAMMLVAPLMHDPCRLEIRGLEGSAGYLDVTAATMRRFAAKVSPTVTGYEISNDGYQTADVVIEPDASAAVYPMVAAAVTGGCATIEGLGRDSGQPDIRVGDVLEEMGCSVRWGSDSVTVDGGDSVLRGIDVDLSDAPDGAMAVAVAALFADGPSRISGLGSLRRKESDRLVALSGEMTRLGAQATASDDTLLIFPREMTGAELSSHGDHRVAMAMALVGLVVPGVSVTDPDVTTKTWPGYWEFLDRLDS
ncbi:MAG: 3-phosphoshikimate 1-carboxyvinyltransferase [Acidimicrobiia bacterium]|jgi:3-phosphoshikimate 1-carboxyvinyltransferase